MGKHRSCKGGRAHDDMVFLDRLHVRRSFFFFGEKETRECEPDGHPFLKIQGHCHILRDLRLVCLPNRKLCSGTSDPHDDFGPF